MILDKLGQEIKVGSIIAYGHALGRCAGIRIGKVLQAKKIPDPHNYDKTVEKWVYRITVQGVDDDWRRIELTEKKGTLQFPDRIIVLPDAIVPEVYRGLLQEVPA